MHNKCIRQPVCFVQSYLFTVTLKLMPRNVKCHCKPLLSAAGIPEAKLIEAHGTFSTATCRRCKTRYKGDEILVGLV